MSRRTLARLVLVVWIAALGWLAQRQLFPGEGSRLATGAQRFPPAARYFRVDVGTLQVGALNVTWDTLPTGLRMQELLALDLPGEPDGLARHLALTEVTTSRALTFQRVTRSYTSQGRGEELAVEVTGDSSLSWRLTMRDGGGSARTRLPLATRPSMPMLLPMRLAFGGELSVGAMVQATVVDPTRQAVVQVTARVLGDTVFVVADSVEADTVTGAWRTLRLASIPTWRLAVTGAVGEDTWWVDRIGRLVRRESPFGVTLQMTPFDYATLAYRDTLRLEGPGPRRSVSGARSLAASGVALDTAAVEARYRVHRADGPVAAATVALLAGGAQATRGDTLTVRRAWRQGTEPAPPGYHEDSSREGDISGRVRAIADSALAGARTRRDSVAGLTRWVATRIAREPSAVRHRSPAVVERARAANPDGMASLLVGMARSTGLAARTVTGVAVTAEGLLGHAWAEVWAGDGWVPVDPWHGHLPASARLVRVAEGGLGRPFESVLRLGALRLEPLAPGAR